MTLSDGRRRVAFVINSLGPGGAERVLTTVIENTPPGDWDVHLVLLDKEQEHRTPPGFVTVHRLDCRGKLVRSVTALHGVLKRLKPDLVVSFLVRANVAAVVAGRMLKLPVVVSERSQLSTHLEGKHRGLKAALAKIAPRMTYPRANHVIAVSEGVRSDLILEFGVPEHRVTSIYNPYDLERIADDGMAAPEIVLPDRFMVSVGRLVESKGFADLIDAYALAHPALPLVILGDGPERAALQARVDALDLNDRITFGGYVRNPFAVVGRADLFVSASHCEGFPNALAEAMALGVPVVATDCPSGPAELLDEREAIAAADIVMARHGVMAPVGDPTILARALDRMGDEVLRRDYGRRAKARMAYFGVAPIMERYWRLFDSVCDRAGGFRMAAATRMPEPVGGKPVASR